MESFCDLKVRCVRFSRQLLHTALAAVLSSCHEEGEGEAMVPVMPLNPTHCSFNVVFLYTPRATVSQSKHRIRDEFQTCLKPLCVDFTVHMILSLSFTLSCECLFLWSSSDAWSQTLVTSFLVEFVTDGMFSI